MKPLLALVALMLCVVVPVRAQGVDLKSSVAAWFGTDQRVAGVGFNDKTTPKSFKIGELAEGRVHAVLASYVRGEGWVKFATAWQGQLVGFSKIAKETPEDRTILAVLREAHKALEESKADKAKVDQALRKLKELRARVGA